MWNGSDSLEIYAILNSLDDEEVLKTDRYSVSTLNNFLESKVSVSISNFSQR